MGIATRCSSRLLVELYPLGVEEAMAGVYRLICLWERREVASAHPQAESVKEEQRAEKACEEDQISTSAFTGEDAGCLERSISVDAEHEARAYELQGSGGGEYLRPIYALPLTPSLYFLDLSG